MFQSPCEPYTPSSTRILSFKLFGLHMLAAENGNLLNKIWHQNSPLQSITLSPCHEDSPTFEQLECIFMKITFLCPPALHSGDSRNGNTPPAQEIVIPHIHACVHTNKLELANEHANINTDYVYACPTRHLRPRTYHSLRPRLDSGATSKKPAYLYAWTSVRQPKAEDKVWLFVANGQKMSQQL